MSGPTLEPTQVASAVQVHLRQRSILPLSFLETELFSRLSTMLCKYMAPADVTYMISELKKDFFSGFTSMDSKQLHNLVHHCRKCDNVEHPPVLPSWNCVDPDLLIIAENPSSAAPYINHLVVALKEAGFSSSRCMLTYVTRCKAYKPGEDVVANCLPYLHTEMAVINPKLTITLGLGSYRALTGDDKSKLADVRGSLVWFGPFAVLPEVSLGWIANQQEKSQSLVSGLGQSMAKAYQFLYTEGSSTSASREQQ